MRTHVSQAGVQEHGCQALSNFAVNDDIEIKIAAEGGVEEIVKATRAHSSHAGVQQQGCRALRNLAVNVADNQEEVAGQGGINVILEAMRANSRPPQTPGST